MSLMEYAASGGEHDSDLPYRRKTLKVQRNEIHCCVAKKTEIIVNNDFKTHHEETFQ